MDPGVFSRGVEVVALKDASLLTTPGDYSCACSPKPVCCGTGNLYLYPNEVQYFYNHFPNIFVLLSRRHLTCSEPEMTSSSRQTYSSPLLSLP